MCNSGIPRGKGRDVRVDDEASRHGIGRGTEPKQWDAYLFRREPKIAPCGTRPKLEPSNSPASAVLLQLHLHLHPDPIITSPTAAQQHGSNLNNIFSQPEQRGKRKLTGTPDRHRHRHRHLHLHLHRVPSGQSSLTQNQPNYHAVNGNHTFDPD
ncbi:hypothetical protein LA080_008928 [Diaporthe eres]|nr:hypothetical protein LA080_008928 [Diaporthe eres]